MSVATDATTSTATTTAAREHARSQAVAFNNAMPVFPPSAWPELPADIPADNMVHAEAIPGGRYTALRFDRGTRIRLIDTTGNACAQLMLWRADAAHERLNTADTVKIPWQAYLGIGHPLLSDQGRILATIIADTSGHHDALAGASTLAANTARYGDGAPESASPAGRELQLLGALKHGLSDRDLPHSVSFFHGVRVNDAGGFKSTGNAGAGCAVDLIVHLPVLAVISNTDHPLDPADNYHADTLHLLAWQATADLEATEHRIDAEPEYQRAVANTVAAVTN